MFKAFIPMLMGIDLAHKLHTNSDVIKPKSRAFHDELKRLGDTVIIGTGNGKGIKHRLSSQEKQPKNIKRRAKARRRKRKLKKSGRGKR